MGAVIDGDVWDFYIGKGEPKATLPVGTVLTLAAAGSEASISSVITNEDGWLKRAVDTDVIYPKFSIMNPELLFTMPDFQVACGATDIMSHLMERYFTNVKNVDFTDRLLEATMKTIIAEAPKVMANRQDYDAWAEFMWAGTIAHNSLLNTGRIGDWGSHMIEHEVSGIYDVAHGAGLAVVFPAWMKYVLKHDVNRFAQWAVRVWNVELDIFDLEATGRAGIARMEAFFQSLGLATTLHGSRRYRRPHRRDGRQGHRRQHPHGRQFRRARSRGRRSGLAPRRLGRLPTALPPMRGGALPYSPTIRLMSSGVLPAALRRQAPCRGRTWRACGRRHR